MEHLDQQQIMNENTRLAEEILSGQYEEPKPAKYIFPNFMASTMSKVSPKVQYESSLMGTVLLLVSVLLTTVFYVFFTQSTWLTKGFIIFNAVAGFLMLSSMLVTTYQQYQQYMGAVALERMLNNGIVEGENIISGKKIKRIRYISGGLELGIIILLSWFLNFWWLMIISIHPIYLLITTDKYIQKQEDLKNV